MKTKSINYLNEISLDYNRKLFSLVKITNSKDAATISREMYQHSKSKIDLKEYFFMMLLNRTNNVIGYIKLSEGGISNTIVDIRIAFATALKCLASAVILVHNHPSGNLKGSEDDKEMTKKFCNAGRILDIAVLDHIILTSESHSSFADEGVLY